MSFSESVSRRNRLIALAALLVCVAVLYALVSGSSVLMHPLLSDALPAGTIITWMGMAALPTAIFFGLPALYNPSTAAARYIHIIVRILIVISLLWGLICFGLAGNWSFTFTEKAEFRGGQSAMKLFWYFTYGLPSLSLIALVAFGLSRMMHRR